MATLTTFNITIPAGLWRPKEQEWEYGGTAIQKDNSVLSMELSSIFKVRSRDHDRRRRLSSASLAVFAYNMVLAVFFYLLAHSVYAWDMGDERIQRHQMVDAALGWVMTVPKHESNAHLLV